MRALKWLLLACTALLVGGCVAVPIGNRLLHSPRSFEAERWRNGDVRERARMAGDLRRSGLLLGKSRAEVLALLGRPDRESTSVWEYVFVHGDVLGDAFRLPFSDWRELIWIEFDAATDRVRAIDMRD